MQILRTLAAGILFAATGPAVAADVFGPIDNAESPIDWSGFYAGVLAGVGAGQAVSTTTGIATTVPLNGGVAGLTLGANTQMQQMVLGVESDIVWAGLTGGATCNLAPAFTCNGEVNWVGTVRGRIGYALDSTLLYATAGLAIAGAKATVTPTPVGLTGTYSDTAIGWTAGAGVEFALSESLSAKAEYLYADYGTVTAPAGTVATPASNIDLAHHAFKIGLNYRF